MQTYRHGIAEPTLFLLNLYKQTVGSFIQESKRNDNLNSFIDDPVHFDYRFFDARWWPLFRFTDIGMEAMRYGSRQIESAVSRLKDPERKKAEYYIGLYRKKTDNIDSSDIYHIPDNVKNPKI
ncbi:MAG: hypothetical protein J5966_04545 [Lachnospiraceae bacterium]|nr:hypothetical protein [Lachnospiraceae bacterium]